MVSDALVEGFVGLTGGEVVWMGLVGGLFIAGLNFVGALGVLVWRDPSVRALDGALGFAAGVMLTASFTSLLLPGVEVGGLFPVFVGFALGVVVLDRADAWVPHVHFLVTGGVRVDDEPVPAGEEGLDGGLDERSGRMLTLVMFVVAVTIHNVPEGLAVGVGFGAGDVGAALALMFAIGLQNVPEGFAVSVAMRNAGFVRPWHAALVGARAGVVELPMAVLGAVLVVWMEPLLPYAMGFAAGGMLFVISDEIVPETHARGNERVATLGTMVGVVVMLGLDLWLG